MFSSNTTQVSAAAAQESGLTLTVAGTYSLVIPTGVTSIAAIAIGAGGGGGGTSTAATSSAAGGGGGALSYSNAIAVTAGETLTIVVGNGGSAGSTAGTTGAAGTDSSISRAATNLLVAKAGSGGGGNTAALTGGGGAGGVAASGVGDTKNTGGVGGARAVNDRGGGGGGAAGYSGTGGAGGTSTTAPTAGGGGGGGGGFYGFDGTSFTGERGGDGGGVQFYGSGSNGIAGVVGGTDNQRGGGLGSSQGSTAGGTGISKVPGGGGGGASSDTLGLTGNVGNDGAVRVLWGGTKSFPSTGVTSNTISLFASAISDTSTITVPSGVEAGDFMVLFDIAFNTSTTPTLVTPSGFTTIEDGNGVNGRINTSRKQVLSSADAGTTLTGMNGNSSNNKILLVFRGTSGYGFDSSSFGNADTSITAAALSATSIGDAAIDSYQQGITVTACAFYGSGGITPGTDIAFTGATFVQGVSNVFYAGYKIYTQATTNAETTGITLADRGTNGFSLGYFLGY
jgi:hypothetical protein